MSAPMHRAYDAAVVLPAHRERAKVLDHCDDCSAEPAGQYGFAHHLRQLRRSAAGDCA